MHKYTIHVDRALLNERGFPQQTINLDLHVPDAFDITHHKHIITSPLGHSLFTIRLPSNAHYDNFF